ncbi:MAG: 1-acyl-sn-glycerol-3-phosphate acyltransferase [Campylobacterales bacterium]|nr:1-acyl-sn-glycerol-3-phosphate acyltransferase [Campylobacterales bacterium]
MIFFALYVPLSVLTYVYFGSRVAGGILVLISVLFIFYNFLKKSELKEFLSPLLAALLGLTAFIIGDFEPIKAYPLIVSILFLTFFIYSVTQKKYPLMHIIQKIKKRALTTQEERDIKLSHLYWIVVLSINSLIHIILFMNYSIKIWAIYSFLGWYLYIGLAITVQILFVHRKELRQWTSNVIGYGLFGGLITVMFFPTMLIYFLFVLFRYKKPHVIFQYIVSKIFRFYFLLIPNIEKIDLKKDPEISDTQNYIYISTHQSWLDYPLLGSYLIDIYHLTNKKEALSWYLKPIAKLLGIVDGFGFNALHELLKKLDQKSNVLIFPEGSRSIDGEIQSFKNGAFSLSLKSDTPIVPIIIEGTKKLVKKGSYNWSLEKSITIRIIMLAPQKKMPNESLNAFAQRIRTLMIVSQKNRND